MIKGDVGGGVVGRWGGEKIRYSDYMFKKIEEYHYIDVNVNMVMVIVTVMVDYMCFFYIHHYNQSYLVEDLCYSGEAVEDCDCMDYDVGCDMMSNVVGGDENFHYWNILGHRLENDYNPRGCNISFLRHTLHNHHCNHKINHHRD